MSGLKNIKVSLKLDNFDYFLQLASLKKRYPSTVFVHNNFFVLKDKYTVILFKPKRSTNVSHVNITKVKNFEDIGDIKPFLFNLFNCFFVPNSLKIDNLTFIHYLRNEVNLSLLYNTFHKSFTFKYNNAIFPGLHYKGEKGAAIIFHTGKVVIVGCRTLQEISELIKTIEGWIVIICGSKMNI